ncbi:hypothetical protein PF007_g32812 [Phytophthora fragariae]|uniref:Uncharacterized protein n=1 Tax=Phytophthora fragariae TaxID=53985 RepID=A0A6A3PFQ3_9STRA|nr:hypothetical protein PF007_g32812 [Phytophthora fragariae]
MSDYVLKRVRRQWELFVVYKSNTTREKMEDCK